MIKKKAIPFFLLSLIIFLSGCTELGRRGGDEPDTKTEFVLGTVVTVQIYDHASEALFDKIFDRLREIEEKMTINQENSEVLEVNKNAGIDFVHVSEDTFHVIQRGKIFSELSRGRFDISIGPLVKLWNIGTEEARVPSREEIDQKKQLVDYRDVLLNESEKSVMLKKEGMFLDLGGIAKGFAADEIVKIFEENHVESGLINVGGNVFAHGNRLDGADWRIGIRNPSSSSSAGDYIGIISVSDKTVVTSGIYERYFEEDGKRYHHILDPETGYPVENNLVSVTVIGEHSVDADALSTAVFSLGLEEGMKLIQELEDTEAIWITKENQVYVTPGLLDHFELTHPQFTLVK